MMVSKLMRIIRKNTKLMIVPDGKGHWVLGVHVGFYLNEVQYQEFFLKYGSKYVMLPEVKEGEFIEITSGQCKVREGNPINNLKKKEVTSIVERTIFRYGEAILFTTSEGVFAYGEKYEPLTEGLRLYYDNFLIRGENEEGETVLYLAPYRIPSLYDDIEKLYATLPTKETK